MLLALVGCDQGPGNAQASTRTPSQGPVALHGAGSTFASPLYTAWFKAYHDVDSQVSFDYAATGSSDGIRQVMRASVDFGGSDALMTDKQFQVFNAAYGCDVLYLPVALGGIVPTYNVPGVEQELKFTPDALAGIFLGRITRWDDRALTDANPGVTLPAQPITVVHRSDGSGTTYMFTDYLAKISDTWKSDVGVSTRPVWPVGLGGEGNKGVAEVVSNTPNSIGYVELGFAIKANLPYGAVRNADGQFVRATPQSITLAAAGVASTMPEHFRVSITNAPGRQAYPIATFTWMLVPQRMHDDGKRAALKKFLTWAIADGQTLLEPLHYARLPGELLDAERAAIESIQ